MSSARVGQGLTDKLYWRDVGGAYHCFKKQQGGGFVSLCGQQWMANSGGQSIRRPNAVFRCAMCDGKEMHRRGWEHSGPGTVFA